MDQNTSYAPRSPDLSAYHRSSPVPPMDQSSYFPHQQQTQQSYTPLANAQYLPPPAPTSNPVHLNQPIFPANQFSMSPAGRSQPLPDMGSGDGEWTPAATGDKPARGRPKSKKPAEEPDYGTKPAPGVEEGIEVKTKFPVARIKRIMQADEDVGKVAQVTPTAVSKALELFMISLVTKSAAQARAKSSKKVTAAHLKQVVQQDEQFDFLADIIAKVPDAPPKKEKAEDSEGAEGETKKRRAPRRKKADDDDF